MVYAFPTNESLWHRYAEIRAEGLRNRDAGVSATEFCREAMSAPPAGSGSRQNGPAAADWLSGPGYGRENRHGLPAAGGRPAIARERSVICKPGPRALSHSKTEIACAL
jgi:hypothetical protein